MEKIRASIVIEILGRPPEHVTEALNSLVTKLGSEKGVKLINKIIHEPQLAKDSKTLFSSFAEVELELDSIVNLFGIVFSYLPAHVEIISPEKVILPNAEMSEFASRLSEKLHEYDAVAKRLLVEREQLVKKLYEIAPNLFKTEKTGAQEVPKIEEAKKIQKPKKSKKKIKGSSE
jgi:hypothetical protein